MKEINDKMENDNEYRPSKLVLQYLKLHEDEYNNVFIDECFLPRKQNDEKCCGFYFNEVASLPMIKNVWIALQKSTCNEYLSKWKDQSNFSQFKQT